MNNLTSNNWTNGTCSDDGPYTNELSDDLLLVAKVFIVVVMAIGIPGNLMTLIVTLRYYDNLRVSGVAFIANLALSDLTYLTVILPIRLLTVFYGRWPLGEVDTYTGQKTCEFTAAMISLLKLTSMLSLAAIAFNRYILIVHSSLYHQWYNPARIRLQIALIWLVPTLLVSLPLVGVWGQYGYHPHVYSCSFMSCSGGHNNVSYESFRLFIGLLGAMTPSGFIFVCYTKIYLHVSRSRQKLNKWNKMDTTKSKSEVPKLGCLGCCTCCRKRQTAVIPQIHVIEVPDNGPSFIYSDNNETGITTVSNHLSRSADELRYIDDSVSNAGSLDRDETSTPSGFVYSDMLNIPARSSMKNPSTVSLCGSYYDGNADSEYVQIRNHNPRISAYSECPDFLTRPSYAHVNMYDDYKHGQLSFHPGLSDSNLSRVSSEASLRDNDWNKIQHDKIQHNKIHTKNLTLSGKSTLSDLSHTDSMISINGKAPQRKKRKNSREKLQLTLSMAVIFGVFLVCGTPHVVVTLVESLRQNATIHYVSILFSMLYGICNPLIYAAMNRHFRLAYRRLFLSCGCNMLSTSDDEHSIGSI